MRSTRGASRSDAIVLLGTWAVLVALTIGSFWFADSSSIAASDATKLILAVAVLKGHLIAGVYMEMRRGPIVWALVMSGFLTFQAILLAVLLP